MHLGVVSGCAYYACQQKKKKKKKCKIWRALRVVKQKQPHFFFSWLSYTLDIISTDKVTQNLESHHFCVDNNDDNDNDRGTNWLLLITKHVRSVIPTIPSSTG